MHSINTEIENIEKQSKAHHVSNLFQYPHVPNHGGPCYNQQVQLPLPTLPPPKPPHRIFGMRGSDIDKYSRVIFPIMFVSFHLMYWMIYISISGDIPDDVVPLE